MKSPTELAAKLARQWQQADLREQRLLGGPGVWPLREPIRLPGARDLVERLAQVRAHLQAWREVGAGRVEWQAQSFRALAEPVDMPVAWCLDSADDWVAASGEPAIRAEFERLRALLAAAAVDDRLPLVRQRSLWKERDQHEVLAALRLVDQLQPGCAAGLPLRALPIGALDSKFIERNRALLIALLDRRYDGAASREGLEGFLAAAPEGEHWLLVVPLDDRLLPFRQLRIRASELAERALPGRRLLVVENERCQHQLPALADTVAVLGCGRNLAWLGAVWCGQRELAYWGDLDSWGLLLLAEARQQQPHLQAVLMDRATFKAHARHHAVTEPRPAAEQPPAELSAEETALYLDLLGDVRGRLEQEKLPVEAVHAALAAWHAGRDVPACGSRDGRGAHAS